MSVASIDNIRTSNCWLHLLILVTYKTSVEFSTIQLLCMKNEFFVFL